MRTETVAEEIDERITERVLVEAVFEVLDTPVRLSHLWELRQLILTAWRREELSDHDAKALLSKYIGYGQLPSQTAGAQTSAREEPKDEPREPVDIDDIILNTTPRESEQIRLFFFPATSPTRHEQLQKLVLSGISMKIIREHVDKPLPVEGVDRVVVWTLAARGPPYIAASKMRPGDVALFYGESGEYTHKAKIVGRIANRELANAITGVDGTFKDTNGDFRVDRPIVVFFEDVTRVSVPSKTLHAALGYNRPYPTWSTVNQQRVSSLTGPERGLEDVLSQFDRRSEEE